jgi:hypothetical protein
MEKFDAENLKYFISESTYRYKHILGVVEEMKELTSFLQINKKIKEELVNIAYLHDIGYSDKLVKTGYHPLDGATFCERSGYSKEVVSAVMFHSGAFEDVERNFPDLMETYLGYKYYLSQKMNIYIDLITYCDLHRSSSGKKVKLKERLEEIFKSYGETHNVSLTIKSNEKRFSDLIKRIEDYKRIGKIDGINK